MSPLCRGRIVGVELLDPQDRNRKCRPAVIVTADADIRDDGDVWKVKVASIQECAGVVPGRQLLDILSRIKPPDAPAEATEPT